MDVMEAIFNRKSIGKVKKDMPPKEIIEQLLESAIQAPNHHHTEPWQFFVVTGKARERLGDIFAQITEENLHDNPALIASKDAVLDAARKKTLRAPVIIIVTVVPNNSHPKVVEMEEIEAGAAAIENLLLAAYAHGLGAMWRTGDLVYHPKVKQFLQLPSFARILGTIYLGYPDMQPHDRKRTPATQKTTWLSN